MAKQSGYLQRQKEVMQAVMEVSEQTTRQLMLDTLEDHHACGIWLGL